MESGVYVRTEKQGVTAGVLFTDFELQYAAVALGTAFALGWYLGQ